jgi:hypothetical protein
MPPPYQAAQIGVLFQEDARTLVEKYGKMVAPFFRIEISDQSDAVLFSAESQVRDANYDLHGLIVSEVSWDENDCQADEMRLTVQNIDMTLHDSRLFAEGNSIDLWMGYDGHQPDYMGRAIIVEIEPQFPSNAVPTLGITAYDVSHFMSEEGRAEIVAEGTRWWEARQITEDPAGDDTSGSGTSGHVRGTNADQARDARQAQRTTGRTGVIPTETLESTGGVPGLADRPVNVHGARRPRDANTQTPQTRTTFQQARIPRRRQRRGKVWRNMTDNEIAEAIFLSYGIIPFTEATNERARARRVTTQNEQLVTAISTFVRNREEEATRARQSARQAGIPASTVPDITVETAGGQRLNLAGRSIRLVGEARTGQPVTVEVGGRRVVQKAGTSDLEFLKKLAKNHDYIVFVFFHYETRNWIGYFGPKNHVPQHVSYTFEYNQGDDTTLASVTPKISTKGQKTEIDMLYTDPISGRQQRLRVSMNNVSSYSPEFRGPDGPSAIEEPVGNGPEVTLTIHGQRTSVVANRRFTSMDDARRWLMSFWIRHASEFCEADGQTIMGLPEIKGRHRHVLNGVGRFSGAYFFTKSTHKMATGSIYTTTFSSHRIHDAFWGEAQSEDENLSVESNEMGVMTPAVQDVLSRWRRALATP